LKMPQRKNRRRTLDSLQIHQLFKWGAFVLLLGLHLALLSPVVSAQSSELMDDVPSLDLPLSWDHIAADSLESPTTTREPAIKESANEGLVITLTDPDWADTVQEENGPSASIAMIPQETAPSDIKTAPLNVEEPALLPGHSQGLSEDLGAELSNPVTQEATKDNVAPLPSYDTPVARTITPTQPYAPSIPTTPNPTAISFQEPIRRILETNQERRPMFASTPPIRAIQLCLPYGVEAQIYDTKVETNANGQRVRRTSGVNAIGALCWNLPFKDDLNPLRTSHLADVIIPKTGPNYQQTPGQLAGMLALARVPDSYAMRCQNREWTVAHLIAFEQRACAAGVDQSQRMLAFSFYLDPQATWTNEQGETWSLSRLAAAELDRPIEAGDSRVTDHLLGLSYGLQAWRLAGLPLTEPWDRVDAYIREYRTFAFSAQNSDGTWNERFFAASGANKNGDKALLANAHILRWLIASSELTELDDVRLLSSISYVSRLLDRRSIETKLSAMTPLQAEGLLIGLHALSLYEQRYFPLFERPAPVTALQSSPEGSGFPRSPTISSRHRIQ
jgi:hypothetical protein